MEKVVSFDKQGRLYIPEEIRKFIQFGTFIAKTQNQGIFLQPIEEDPIEALSRLGNKLKNKSIIKLKEEARLEIEKDAIKKIRG